MVGRERRSAQHREDTNAAGLGIEIAVDRAQGQLCASSFDIVRNMLGSSFVGQVAIRQFDILICVTIANLTSTRTLIPTSKPHQLPSVKARFSLSAECGHGRSIDRQIAKLPILSFTCMGSLSWSLPLHGTPEVRRRTSGLFWTYNAKDMFQSMLTRYLDKLRYWKDQEN